MTLGEHVALAVIVVAALLVGYAYVGYPLLLMVLADWRRTAASRRVDRLPEWPAISITVPVYNEATNMAAKLEALLGLEYPADRRQILVVSDASNDGTDDIAARFADRGVELLRLPQRRGKTAAENAARHVLRGEIVVNTDASVRIHPQALQALVAAFADPSVGVASCRDVSVARTEASGNLGETGYVGYEMWVRRLETRVYGLVGVSGCLYAIRKPLHMDLVPEALSRDFAAALVAREHGLRTVAVDEAMCYVPRTSSTRQEYRRKVRTMTRGLETLWYKRSLLNPLRYGVFAWMLFSHKLCRWLAPWALAAVAAGVAVLAVRQPWARWVLAAQGVLIGLGVAGWVWPPQSDPPRLLSLAAYGVVGTLAALRAWANGLRGELEPVWEPTRREPVGAPRNAPLASASSATPDRGLG